MYRLLTIITITYKLTHTHTHTQACIQTRNKTVLLTCCLPESNISRILITTSIATKGKLTARMCLRET